jgi:putative membrane protein
VAISVLPALYAWVNIYANGNPYANTGEIQIAVASLDPGLDLEDGSHINMADEVQEELKQKDTIGWQFPGSADEAIEGVKSGKYYAAIVFEDNFTYNMYHLKDAVRSEKAALTFYQNAKRNAIAAKITDTAAEALQQNINSQYLQTVFSTVFGETKALTDETEEKKPVDAAVEELEHLRSTLGAYDESISVFLATNTNVASNVSKTMKDLKHTRSTSKKIIDQAKADMKDARKSVQIVENKLNSLSADIGKDLNKLEKDVTTIGPNPAEKQAIDRVRKESNALLKELQELKALLPTDSKLPGIKLVINTVDSMIFQIQNMEELLNQLPAT